MNPVTIRPMVTNDWPTVASIYLDGITTGHATFESAVPQSQDFFATKLPIGLNVAERDGAIIGWTSLSPVSSRPAYRGVAEHSIYIAEAARGTGAGKHLLHHLLNEARDHGIWTIQASIFPENTASIRLHTTSGFRVIGYRERIAYMTYGPQAGQWRNTTLIEWRAPHSPEQVTMR